MKVLLDEGMNPRVESHLRHAHEVKHMLHLGWRSLNDGSLLERAEALGYEVLITTDKRMTKQQNNLRRRVALVVLPTNATDWIRRAHYRIAAAVEASTPGSFMELPWSEPVKAND